ncbi:MAG: hydrogen gas-evolving membrane-bound hydrogenase subunit E [Promethearchaeota archaeon]|jgi:multisubunit Na+/H+ antiporter MnhB subunit
MNKRNIVAIVFFAVVAVCFIVTAIAIHDFGKPNSPNMDDYIINNCQEETGANNAVTSVVFDYRGFDTLGEATVLFSAVAGVIILLRRLTK